MRRPLVAGAFVFWVEEWIVDGGGGRLSEREITERAGIIGKWRRLLVATA
jgi:hypothetical protein